MNLICLWCYSPSEHQIEMYISVISRFTRNREGICSPHFITNIMIALPNFPFLCGGYNDQRLFHVPSALKFIFYSSDTERVRGKKRPFIFECMNNIQTVYYFIFFCFFKKDYWEKEFFDEFLFYWSMHGFQNISLVLF